MFNSAFLKIMFPSLNAVKLCRGIAFACLFVLPSFSAIAAPAPSKSSGGKHCLWRVSNAKAPFYLLGSVHRLRDGDYPLPAVVVQAIDQSQQFYFEYDANRDDEFGQKLEAAAKLPRGT